MGNDTEQKLLNSSSGNQWKRFGVKHHHGICVPLFSLHSQNSCGIGEYTDLYAVIDWCKEIGLDLIQLLPLNDTGLDPSPYNSISAFALNPLNLSISSLPLIEKIPNLQDKLNGLRQWNHTARINYSIVRKLKNDFLNEYFQVNFKELSENKDFKDFVEQNRWLESFALFCALKERNQWKSWEDWPNQEKSPSENSYKELLSQRSERIHFYELIQFLCFQQLSKVKDVAQSKGILIKGDIPILISRDSADVWTNKRYFLINYSAGAPPDMFSDLGQNWGFPIYDWEALEKSQYDWWIKRLQFAEKLYHLYRIDHVVGFFRIWAIPKGLPGKDGHFFPQDESQWITQGKRIMEMMLKCSSMLPIGEDLGVVPPSVRMCLSDLGICGTKVIRWERRWDEDKSFIPFNEYKPESMTTVSTHDSDTLQLWWKHLPKEAKEYAAFKGWDYQPFLSLDRHADILRDSHHSNSLFHINLLQEYLTLFPQLVSSNPNDERINVPGKVADTNWTYRLKPSVEELITHNDLKNTMRSLIN